MKKIGNLKIHSSSEIKKSRVSIGFECMDRDVIKWEPCIEPLGQTGAKYARVQTGWIKCEKTKGVYNFKWLDDIVDALMSKGIIVWFDVSYGNPIYMDDISTPSAVGCVPTLYGEETEQAWKNYVKALCEHYRDRVKLYEIWNEPNIPQFWYPKKPDAKEFSKLYKLTADIIKNTIPDARIGCNIAFFSENFTYERTFFENITPDEIDFFGYHAYKIVPENMYCERVGSFKRWLDENGFYEVQIWQGEAGYPSWAPKGHWLINEGTDAERPQAVWLLRRFFNDFKVGTTLSSFFQIADMWEKPYETASGAQQKCAGHGILHGLTYEKKESFRTFSIIANIMSGELELSDECFVVEADGVSQASAEFEYSRWSANNPIEKITFVRNGHKLYEFHAIVNVAQEYHFDAKITLPYSLKNPVLLDCYTGEIFEIEELNHIDLTEYPKIICEREALEIV